MDVGIFLVVSSNDSLEYFPKNKPDYFTTLLSTPLDLSGQWSIGLKEIVFNITGDLGMTENLTTKQLLFDVFLSQSTGCILSGVESMLLRRFFFTISKGEKTIAVSFNDEYMMPLKSSYINRTDIIIKPTSDSTISVDKQVTAHATLVLKKVQF